MEFFYFFFQNDKIGPLAGERGPTIPPVDPHLPRNREYIRGGKYSQKEFLVRKVFSRVRHLLDIFWRRLREIKFRALGTIVIVRWLIELRYVTLRLGNL